MLRMNMSWLNCNISVCYISLYNRIFSILFTCLIIHKLIDKLINLHLIIISLINIFVILFQFLTNNYTSKDLLSNDQKNVFATRGNVENWTKILIFKQSVARKNIIILFTIYSIHYTL